jgi:hypothetical protein
MTFIVPHGSVWVVRLWCGICTDPVLRCVNNLEGMNCGGLLDVMAPKFMSWLTV